MHPLIFPRLKLNIFSNIFFFSTFRTSNKIILNKPAIPIRIPIVTMFLSMVYITYLKTKFTTTLTNYCSCFKVLFIHFSTLKYFHVLFSLNIPKQIPVCKRFQNNKLILLLHLLNKPILGIPDI